jgi:hypothetical protein
MRFDVLAQRLQCRRPDHKLPSLAPLAHDFTLAEELDRAIGRLPPVRHDRVLVQLTQFSKSCLAIPNFQPVSAISV